MTDAPNYDRRRMMTFTIPPPGELPVALDPIEILSVNDLVHAVRHAVGVPVESVSFYTCIDGSILWNAIIPDFWPLGGTITVALTTDGAKVYAEPVVVVDVGQDQLPAYQGPKG